eukprot:5155296-Amphidinium_carterae.1
MSKNGLTSSSHAQKTGFVMLPDRFLASLTILLRWAESFLFKSEPPSPLGPDLQGASSGFVPELPKLLNV